MAAIPSIFDDRHSSSSTETCINLVTTFTPAPYIFFVSSHTGIIKINSARGVLLVFPRVSAPSRKQQPPVELTFMCRRRCILLVTTFRPIEAISNANHAPLVVHHVVG